MSCLYVNESGAVISVEGGYFCVKQKNGLVRRLPKELLESITIFGNSSITTPCMQECLRRGITLNYFSGKGAYYGKLSSTRHVNGERLKSQIYACDDPVFCLTMAKQIVTAKIHNQCVILRRYRRNRMSDIDNDEIKTMKQLEHRVQRAQKIDELMGIEGMAARTYFSGLSALVRPEFAFEGRNRQPPRDAFNAMLSLGYTLLMYEIYAEIENRGMNPYIGFCHQLHSGHPALASDLMEEWRAVVVDSVVMSLVQGNEIQPEHFEPDEETGGILLTAQGMRIFIRKMEGKFESTSKYLKDVSTSLRRCFYLQSVDFAKAVEERNASLYQPVIIR